MLPYFDHRSTHVDEKLPTLQIPLNGNDVLEFNFDAPYQQTYEGLFFGDEIDYAMLPQAWERYSSDDQARILSRLLTLRDGKAITQGSPQTIETLSLQDAERQWKA